MPTIKATCKIKQVTIGADGAQVKFEGLYLTSEHYKQLSTVVGTDDRVEITIKPTQETMNFKE